MGRTDTEESAVKSADWSGEETEKSEYEDKVKTAVAVGAGEVRNMLTETPFDLEGSSAEKVPEGSTAGEGATSDATPKDAEAVGVGGGGCHGAGKRER